jgi:hypothetical protein
MDEILETLRVSIDVIFDWNIIFASLFEDFFAMLIGAGLEANFFAAHHHISPQHVSQDIVHRVAQVRITVDIWDCCGDIVFFHKKYYITYTPSTATSLAGFIV